MSFLFGTAARARNGPAPLTGGDGADADGFYKDLIEQRPALLDEKHARNQGDRSRDGRDRRVRPHRQQSRHDQRDERGQDRPARPSRREPGGMGGARVADHVSDATTAARGPPVPVATARAIAGVIAPSGGPR